MVNTLQPNPTNLQKRENLHQQQIPNMSEGIGNIVWDYRKCKTPMANVHAFHPAKNKKGKLYVFIMCYYVNALL